MVLVSEVVKRALGPQLTTASASYMGMAFFYAPYGEAQWRGPLGIALLWPFMMLIIIALPVVPESPRFLLMRGRIEEAREVTMKLHAVKGDPDQEFARAEFYQMSKVSTDGCSFLRASLI